MSVSQAANVLEGALGHDGGDAITKQDVSTYSNEHGGTMKALTWQGTKKVKVMDVPRPKLLEPTDVILKVTGTTVCGSDLHLLHGAVVEMKAGDILGHEFCGVADEIGTGVSKVKKGKRYVASFQIACGDCFYCQNKLSSQCEKTNTSALAKHMYGSQTAGIFGYSHFTGGFAGGQAEYVRVPLADVNLLELPDNVPDEKALYLSDVLCTSYHCVHDTGVFKGDHVAVFGAGPIGHMAGIFAADAGAARVAFVDTEPRLSYVRENWPKKHAGKMVLVDFKELGGGVLNLSSKTPTVVSRLRELCGENGRGPDVALECAAGEYAKGWLHWAQIQLGAETDTSEILNEMIQSVRNYGRVGVTGVYVGYTNHFAIGSVMQRGIRFIGNGQAPVHKYWDDLLKKLQTGQIDPTPMISHRVRLEDLDRVYYVFEGKEDGMQKVFAETKFSFPRASGTPELTKYE